MTDIAEKTLYLDWYKDAPNEQREREKYYVEQVEKLFGGQEGQTLQKEVGERRRTEGILWN